MLKRLAEKIWWVVPYRIRTKSVRIFQPKFTVSVVGLITNENSEVLILDHFFRPRFSWGLPGGFLNTNEKPEDGIRREIFEEAGLEIEHLRLLNVRTVGTHIEILFRGETNGEARVNSGEIRGLGWFTLENLPEMSEIQIHFLTKVLTK